MRARELIEGLSEWEPRSDLGVCVFVFSVIGSYLLIPFGFLYEIGGVPFGKLLLDRSIFASLFGIASMVWLILTEREGCALTMWMLCGSAFSALAVVLSYVGIPFFAIAGIVSATLLARMVLNFLRYRKIERSFQEGMRSMGYSDREIERIRLQDTPHSSF